MRRSLRDSSRCNRGETWQSLETDKLSSHAHFPSFLSRLKYGIDSGWIGIGTALVLIPIIWVITYRIFPKTPMGKKLILGKPDSGRGDAIPDHQRLQELLHQTGIVRTPLRPVGMCEFDGRRFECVSETGYIEIDKNVQVIRVEGSQLTVRLVNESEEN